MSKADELLERAWATLVAVQILKFEHIPIIADIRTYLDSEPAEPSGDYVLGEGSPYYTERERVSRKPMTEEEMRKGSGEWAHLHNIFEEGIRFAEKHHFGIGGDDE